MRVLIRHVFVAVDRILKVYSILGQISADDFCQVYRTIYHYVQAPYPSSLGGSSFGRLQGSSERELQSRIAVGLQCHFFQAIELSQYPRMCRALYFEMYGVMSFSEKKVGFSKNDRNAA